MARTVSNESAVDRKLMTIQKKVALSSAGLLLVVLASPPGLAAPSLLSEPEVMQTSLPKELPLQPVDATELLLTRKKERRQNVGSQLLKNEQTSSKSTESNSVVREYNQPHRESSIAYLAAFIDLLMSGVFNSGNPIAEYKVLKDNTLTLELPAEDNCFVGAEPVGDDSVMIPTALGVVVTNDNEGGFVQYITLLLDTGYAEVNDVFNTLSVSEDFDRVDGIYQKTEDWLRRQSFEYRGERKGVFSFEEEDSLAYLIWNVELVLTDNDCPNSIM